MSAAPVLDGTDQYLTVLMSTDKMSSTTENQGSKQMQDEIRIQGRDVPFDRTRLAIADLTLDPENPRIQYLIGRQSEPITQDRLDELLWGKDQVKALGQ